jgi:hypothetical protein
VRPPTLAHSARRPPPLCASRAIAPDRYTERSAEIWLDWLKSGKAIGRPHLHRDPPRSQSQLLQEAACTGAELLQEQVDVLEHGAHDRRVGTKLGRRLSASG